MPGYKGGKVFSNDGRNGGAVLPDNGGIYKKFDVYPNVPGVNRGSERLVIEFGGSGGVWYTADHYITFYKIH